MLLYHNHTVRVTSELELIHFIFVLLKQFLPIVEDKSCSLVLASPLLHTEMAARLVLLLSCLCVAATTAVNRGSIQVGREGVRSLLAIKCDQVEGYGEVWVISPDWANVQVQGNGFTLYGNSRMYFASRPTDGFDADAYWQVAIRYTSIRIII